MSSLTLGTVEEVLMTDKTSPRRTSEPWTDSVHQKEQQGTQRESHATQKLKSEKEARRRDDKSPERAQNDSPGGKGRAGSTVKDPRGRG